MERSGVVVVAALLAWGGTSIDTFAQCDGPVVVQVPKEAASIADAVAMACPGHPLEIVLDEGTWPMAVDTEDPSIEITIRGVSKTASIVTETKPGVQLNARYGSPITFTSLTVQDVSLSTELGYQWDVGFVDCIVTNCVGSFTEGGATDSTFIECSGGFYGLIDTTSAGVTGCSFVSCANAISVWCDGVVIESCSFENYLGQAVRLKAQATIRASTFNGGLGPALETSGGSGNCGLGDPTQPYVLEDCTFTNCASGVPGGAISDRTDANTPRVWLITNCTFTNNSAPSGGAMYFGIDRNVTLTNCVFEGNSATAGSGGAFGHEFGGWANQLEASNCTFTGNQATERGGAVFTTGWSGSYTISDCTFLANTGTDGGGFYNDRGTIEMDACVYIDNDASLRGGGVYLESGADGLIANCAFTSNHASRGGAVEMYSYAFADIDSCVFIENSALIRGGAIELTLPTSPQVRLCEFVGNESPIGASIARWNTAGTLTPEVVSCQFRSHDGNSSDAVVSCSDGSLILSASTFCDNAIPATFGDVTFDASNCVVEFCTDADGDGEIDACACPGDLNGNFTTDGADLSILLGYWGPVSNPNAPGDLNDDGQVDGADLAVMLGGWGECP